MKIFAPTLITTILVSSVALAGFKPLGAEAQKGGFKGPMSGITTVAEALKAKDDALVHLKGHITKQVKHEKYEFKDNTGSVVIEIDDDDWHGLEVTPNDTVTITGEVEKDFAKPVEIDVKSIQK